MRASVREIYFYAVSFIMLILVVSGLFQIVGATVALFEPAGLYRFSAPVNEIELRARFASQYPELAPEEIAAMAREELERTDREERARANYLRWQRLVNAAAWVAIAFPIYRYHWRRARQSSSLEEKQVTDR